MRVELENQLQWRCIGKTSENAGYGYRTSFGGGGVSAQIVDRTGADCARGEICRSARQGAAETTYSRFGFVQELYEDSHPLRCFVQMSFLYKDCTSLKILHPRGRFVQVMLTASIRLPKIMLAFDTRRTV
jgi:hypothetical protein